MPFGSRTPCPTVLGLKTSILYGRDLGGDARDLLVRSVARDAALCGRLDILRDTKARVPDSPLPLTVPRFAAERGHLDIVEWILGDDPSSDNMESAIKGAIVAKQWHVIDALMARYPTLLLAESAPVWESAICQSAHAGIDALEHASLLYKGSATMFADARWISQAIANVARENGSLDVIKHLCERYGAVTGIPTDPHAVDAAAEHGDLDMVRWLCDRLGWNGNHCALTMAVFYGRADVVRYLCEQGMGPLVRSVGIWRAAWRGYAGVFRALHDHGLCDSNLLREALSGAIEGHQADLVGWLCDAYPQVHEWASSHAKVFECHHGCDFSALMFADVDLDWVRVMHQYDVHGP